MNNILCKLGKHKYPIEYDYISEPFCPKWDDCDIKEHQIRVFDSKCRRCGHIRSVRLRSIT